MNQVATRASSRLPPAAPAIRPPSEPLARAMALALRSVDAADAAADRLTPGDALAVAEDAKARLASAEAALAATPTPEAIADWVLHVATLIGHPSDADSIRAKQAALASTLSALPRRCITLRSAEMVASLSGRFFPALAEILAWLHGEADELRGEVARLRAVLRIAGGTAKPEAEQPEDWSPDAIARRVEAIARGPLDRWTVMQVTALARNIARHAPDQLPAAEKRLRDIVAAAQDADRAAAEAGAASGPDRRAWAMAQDPETPMDALRALAASQRPGAALARMRLQVIEARRAQRGGNA